MHESSLARQVLEKVLERANAVQAKKVYVVHGWVAETEALSPKSLGFHFSAHAKGTAAEGARLELRLIHVEARCLECGTSYPPEHHLLLCPSCGSTDAEELGQTGLCIERLELD